MPEDASGIYLNKDTKRVLRVNATPVAPPAPWTRISDDASLGLAAIRAVVAEKGMLADTDAIAWQYPAIA